MNAIKKKKKKLGSLSLQENKVQGSIQEVWVWFSLLEVVVRDHLNFPFSLRAVTSSWLLCDLLTPHQLMCLMRFEKCSGESGTVGPFISPHCSLPWVQCQWLITVDSSQQTGGNYSSQREREWIEAERESGSRSLVKYSHYRSSR